jgi:hypothetical protein
VKTGLSIETPEALRLLAGHAQSGHLEELVEDPLEYGVGARDACVGAHSMLR